MSGRERPRSDYNMSQALWVAEHRVQKEFKRYKDETAGTLSYVITPVPRHTLVWEVMIEGPAHSPYAGGIFALSIKFPSYYPFLPPWVTFKTKIFHPNIDPYGRICLDMLTEKQWTAAILISHVLLGISSLLVEPNPDDAIMPDIAHLYRTDKVKYEQIARGWTREFAKP